jgi:hypothetical protein
MNHISGDEVEISGQSGTQTANSGVIGRAAAFSTGDFYAI